MNTAPKILVAGASGVLGQLICREVIRIFNPNVDLFVGDYCAERGQRTAMEFHADFRYTPIDDEDALARSFAGMDLVIVAFNQREPIIQKVCIERSIKCIDLTAFDDGVSRVEELHEERPDSDSAIVMLAGFFPGLSGLLVKKAVAEFSGVSEVNIALVQNTNAKAGASGVLDMLRIISQPVEMMVQNEKVTIPGFRLKREINLPGLNRKYHVRRINSAEKSLVASRLKLENVYYWTGWNSRLFNAFIALLKNLGVIKWIVDTWTKERATKLIKHNPLKTEETMLIAEVKGFLDNKPQNRMIVFKTFSDFETTAMVAAALSKIAIEKDLKGLLYPWDMTTLEEVLSIVDDHRMMLKTTTAYPNVVPVPASGPRWEPL